VAVQHQTENKAYQANKPLEELSPVEALVLINRWLKLKSRFYYADADKLYSIKTQQILKMFQEGAMLATRVIVRDTEVLAHIRTAIANRGSDLSFLNLDDDREELTVEEQQHWQIIRALVDGDGIPVNYPEDIYQSWIATLKPEIDAYNLAKAAYDAENRVREPLLKQYAQDCNRWGTNKQKAAIDWANKNGVTIARSKHKKVYKKGWLEQLEKQGFCYDVPAPKSPFPKGLSKPKPPKLPDKTYKLKSFEQYVPGSIQAVDDAIAWASQKYGEGFPEHYAIDEDFYFYDFEVVCSDQYLQSIVEKALAIFNKIVDGELTNSQEIWDQLKILNLDYSAIGIRPSLDRWDYWYYEPFGKWHEINLSPKGYWLVEFEHAEIPGICLHIPYQCAVDSNTLLLVNLLPHISDDSSMGRPISSEEQLAYPLEALVGILGYSKEDFPHQLRSYAQTRHDNYV